MEEVNYVNDNLMYYDIRKHQYILTPDAIVERYGINLADILDSDGMVSPDRLPEMFLEEVSRSLYAYIYLWAKDRDKTMYVLSLPKYRDGIQACLEALTYAYLLSNTNPGLYFTGNSLNAIEVNPQVQTMLLQYKLIFRGEYRGLPEDYKDKLGITY